MPERQRCSCGCPNTFDDKLAREDLRRYRKDGPDKVTRALIEAIAATGIEGRTLLDVGGGIGAIQLELLERGLASAASVDATEAYVSTAAAEARQRGLGERVHGRVGDFVDLAPEIDPADIVTLDKVVCCDPDLDGLLGAVASHARRVIGLVYPRLTWWNRIAARVLAAWGWLTRDPTRWYLHEDAAVDARLRAAGFQRREVSRTFIWQVALYVKPAAAS